MLGRLEYKWIVGIVFVFGLFMDLLDMTIVNVAIPTLAEEFNTSTTTIQWVVTGYLLSLAVFIPVSGWLGDRFGTKRIFMTALFIFTSSSLLCGLSWSIESLITFRILQGIGGGMLTPVGTAMLFRAFPPHERAKGAAILTIPMVVAPASGPVLGGYLVEFHTWREIFFINVPVGVLAFAFALFFLREEKQHEAGSLDIPGFVLGCSGLASVVYALSEAGSRSFNDVRVIGFGLAGLAILAAFAAVELRAREPMIDIRLFKNKLFAATNTVQIIGQGGLMGALFLLPLLLQAEMGMSPLESGLTTFPQAIGVVTMIQVAGRIYPHIGPRRMMMAGMLGATLTTGAFLFVGLNTDPWWIRLIMYLRGAAFSMVLVSLQTATFATISPRDMGRASALYNSGRQVAASFGVAVLASVLENRLSHHGTVLGPPPIGNPSIALDAFHEAFLVAAVLTILGIAACFLVSDKEAAVSMQRAPSIPEPEEAPAAVL